MSTAGAAKPVVLTATLLGLSCSLSGCLLNFGPSHSEAMVDKDSTTAEATTSTEAPEPTTTTENPQCADYESFVDGKRAQAAPLVPVKGDFKDEADCCSECMKSDNCMAWQFLFATLECSLIPNNAVWSAPSGEELFIIANGYTVGMKKVVTCDGCDNCGRSWEDDQSWWKDCTMCGDPANWNQYPCFLPDGCSCGGDMSPWYPPDPCEGEPCDDDNWNPDCCNPCDGEPCDDDNWNPDCCDGGDGGDGGDDDDQWNDQWAPVSV